MEKENFNLWVKENLKGNLKEFEKNIQENKKLNEDLEKAEQETLRAFKELEDYKAEQEKENKIRERITINGIKRALLKNNLHYFLKQGFLNVQQEMLEIYENKNIGEKTREKMQDRIKENFKTNFDIKINCSICSTTYGLEFSLLFSDKNGCNDLKILNYTEAFKILFEKYAHNDYKTQIKYNYDLNDCLTIKDLTPKAKELHKEHRKTVEKIKKLNEQQKAIYENFKQYKTGFLYEKLEIETNYKIY